MEKINYFFISGGSKQKKSPTKSGSCTTTAPEGGRGLLLCTLWYIPTKTIFFSSTKTNAIWSLIDVLRKCNINVNLSYPPVMLFSHLNITSEQNIRSQICEIGKSLQLIISLYLPYRQPPSHILTSVPSYLQHVPFFVPILNEIPHMHILSIYFRQYSELRHKSLEKGKINIFLTLEFLNG